MIFCVKNTNKKQKFISNQVSQQKEKRTAFKAKKQIIRINFVDLLIINKVCHKAEYSNTKDC